jgi:hypothetical protein
MLRQPLLLRLLLPLERSGLVQRSGCLRGCGRRCGCSCSSLTLFVLPPSTILLCVSNGSCRCRGAAALLNLGSLRLRLRECCRPTTLVLVPLVLLRDAHALLVFGSCR